MRPPGHAWEKQPYYLKRRAHMASVALHFPGLQGWCLTQREINLAYLA